LQTLFQMLNRTLLLYPLLLLNLLLCCPRAGASPALRDGIDRYAHALDAASARLSARAKDRAADLRAQGHSGRARGWSWLSRIVRSGLKYKMLSKTSLEVGGGLRLNALRVINAGFFVNYWTGDLACTAPGKPPIEHVNYGLAAETPCASIQAARIGGVGGGISLPFVSAFIDQRQWRLKVGIPGVIALGCGEFLHRGPYLELSLGVPFAQMGVFGLQVNGHAFLYTPLLKPITKRIRPLAVKVRDLTERAKNRVQLPWRKKKKLTRPEPAPLAAAEAQRAAVEAQRAAVVTPP
jgi:hypothetical protein